MQIAVGTHRHILGSTFLLMKMVDNFFGPKFLDEEIVPLCVSCHPQLFSKEKQPCMPPHSIVASKQFGRLVDLPTLMDMEE